MLWAAVLLVAASAARAQNIRGRYVSRAQEDGTVYHTFPETLFEHPEAGDLTFDITYKSGQEQPLAHGKDLRGTGQEALETPLRIPHGGRPALPLLRRTPDARSVALCRRRDLPVPGEAERLACLCARRVPDFRDDPRQRVIFRRGSVPCAGKARFLQKTAEKPARATSEKNATSPQ